MAALSKVLRSVEGGRVAFWCPGCDGPHALRVEGDERPRWGYNGNADAPTFTPSILCAGHEWTPPVTSANLEQWKANPWKQEKVDTVCHSFVTDGRIQFLGDCTHALAGQTVDLPEWPEGEAC